jgi:hypothetical protein
VAAAGYLESSSPYFSGAATATAMQTGYTPADFARILAIRKKHSHEMPTRAVDMPPLIKHQYYLPVTDYQHSCD